MRMIISAAHKQDSEPSQEQGDEAQFLLDNLEENVDCYSLPTDFDEIVALSASRAGHSSSLELLLLDSCSTLNLISNPDLLRDIHDVPAGIVVHCNAGDVFINKMGYLGDFPVPVWYNPNGIANILSLHIIAQHYHIRYDSRKKDAFYVTGPDNVRVDFVPTTKGLYACDAKSDSA